ncbi:vanadium-dependent haloperoxidase [Flavitalea sp.]|nr:vanadium-dependent haloperoxidase [Flavitalea sp.]
MKSARFYILTFVVFCAISFLIACSGRTGQADRLTNQDIGNFVGEMSDLMLHDVTSPPLAARFFGYTFLSGYEILSQHDSSYRRLAGKLNDYPVLSAPDSIEGYDYRLAALLSMIGTASKMQPSGKLLEKYRDQLLASCIELGYTDGEIEASLRYASAVSKKMLQYAKSDGYNKISNFARYTPVEGEGSWYPTPPAFMPAVEPYFHTIRSFTFDSSSQFKPEPPVPFSKKTNSAFYLQLLLNYNAGKAFPADSLLIAAYWDCNPFALQDGGHMQVGLKKISPGAHWLGITGIACKKANKTFNESLRIHTYVSLVLMDGFLACWDEKFRSNRIRPETAIRKYKDPTWKPLLQTPPFPEYPSGHSTISAAAAVVLTKYLGDQFEYTDTVEVKFGLPSRKFSSFNQAADEAGMSRFYGGIHFIDAIVNGREQGIKVANHFLKVVEK